MQVGEIMPVFGKAIYSNKLDINTESIVSLIEAPIKSNDAGWEYKGKESLYVLEDEKFKDLKEAILTEFKHYISDNLKYTNKFKITTSWFTVLEESEKAQVHNHHNCFISGVLYLQTNSESGNITFTDFTDNRFLLLPKEYNIFNSKEWSYKPEDGLILFFPSELHHGTEENTSKQTRHSLSFNIIPTGILGNEKSDSHYEQKD